jgi:hypothetical protein
MTGRLQGTALGRPVEINADGQELMLRVPNLRAAWRLRHSGANSMIPMLQALCNYGVRFRLRIGERQAIKILPEPHFALRMMVPALRFAKSETSQLTPE